MAIIATENEDLLAHLADMAATGKAVFGLKSEHLVRTRLLHDRLADVVNDGRTNHVVMEN